MRIGILMGLTDRQKGWLATNICAYFDRVAFRKNYVIIPLYGNFAEEKNWDEIKTFNLDYLINAIGYAGDKNIDDCETAEGKIKSWNSNYVAARQAARFCQDNGVIFFHLSTGMVFSGHEVGPKFIFDESSWTEPDGVYSEHKKMIEDNIKQYYSENSIIIRIHNPHNGDSIQRNLIHRMKDFKKVYTIPQSMTYVPDLYHFIQYYIEYREKFENQGCIFHVVSEKPISMSKVADYWRNQVNIKYEAVAVEGSSGRKEIVLSAKKIIDLGFQPTEVEIAVLKSCLSYAKKF